MSESNSSRTLVAASTNTPSVSLPTSFICNRSSPLSLLADSLAFEGPQRKSMWSMKMMEGLRSFAISKIIFNESGDLDGRSEGKTEKKVTSISVATAAARYDFPVPGGYTRKKKKGTYLKLK